MTTTIAFPKIQVHVETIPDELKQYPHFVNWQYGLDDKGKITKVPKNPRTLNNAMSTNPATWGSYADAVKNINDHTGIGFVPSANDDIIGIDIDDCRNKDTGEIDKWALLAIKDINTYTEISPSGEGIRLFVKGKLPAGWRKTEYIEVYDKNQYLTITGNILDVCTNIATIDGTELHEYLTVIVSDLKIIQKASNAKNGEKFKTLFSGSYIGYGSQSEGELACCSLVYYHTKELTQIDRIYRYSGLCRAKWDARHRSDGKTYGEMTLEKLQGNGNQQFEVDNTDTPHERQHPIDVSFPDILTGVAGDYARMMSQYLEVPIHFHFMAFLTCLGNILSDLLTLVSSINPQPRFYTLLLGESADVRKSTAIKKVTEFFKRYLTEFEVCWGVGSAEGLQKRLEGKKKLLLCLDEFKQFVSKCRLDGSVLLPCVTTLFENNFYESQTKTTSVILNDVYLSMLCASTVETYEATWDSSFTDIGFTNRLFLVPGNSQRLFSIPAEIPEKKFTDLWEQTRAVLEFVKRNPQIDIEDNARKNLNDWYMNRGYSVHAKRLDTYALRCMPLLSASKLQPVIDINTVDDTIKLMDWQLCVRKLYAPIDADNKIAQLEERMRRHLRIKSLSERDLQRAIHYERHGIFYYNTARDNLLNSHEIGFNKESKEYFSRLST